MFLFENYCEAKGEDIAGKNGIKYLTNVSVSK